jgi:hypothetical protein
MSLDSLYSRQIEANFLRRVSRADPLPETSFSLSSFLGAGFAGPPAGLLEVAGTGADVLSVAERASRRAARPAVLADQPPPRTTDFAMGGDPFRAKAAEFAPDPQTAHVADQLMFGLTRVATKAVGAMVAAGPVAGSALLGAEEANTAYRGLIERGIDPDTALLTASTIGAVTGLTVGLPVSGAALPLSMAGKTAATVGLVGVGGPGAFIAQETIARNLLAGAGYDTEAATHDPYDPLALAVSTILPGGFGAWALRNAAKQSRIAPPTTEKQALEAAKLSPEEQAASDAFERSDANLAQLRDAIKAEKDPANRAILEQELRTQEAAAAAAAREVPPVADEPTLDAARVLQVERALTNNLPDAPGSREAVLKATDELAAGRFPDIPPPREAGGIDAAALLAKAEEPFPWDEPRRPINPPAAVYLQDDLRGMAKGAEWAIRGGELMRSGRSEPGDQSMGGFVTGRTPWVPAQEWYGRMRSSLGTSALSDRADIEIAVEKAIRGKKLTAREQRTVDYMRQEAADMQDQLRGMRYVPDEAYDLSAYGMEAGLSRTDANDLALTARAAELDDVAVERAAIQYENDDAAFMAEIRRIINDNDSRASAIDGGTAVRSEAAEPPAFRDDPEPAEPAADTAQPAEPAPQGQPRDLKAELIELRKAESLLAKLLECVS